MSSETERLRVCVVVYTSENVRDRREGRSTRVRCTQTHTHANMLEKPVYLKPAVHLTRATLKMIKAPLSGVMCWECESTWSGLVLGLGSNHPDIPPHV